VRAVVAPRARYCALGQCVVPQRSEMDLCSGGSRCNAGQSCCMTRDRTMAKVLARSKSVAPEQGVARVHRFPGEPAGDFYLHPRSLRHRDRRPVPLMVKTGQCERGDSREGWSQVHGEKENGASPCGPAPGVSTTLVAGFLTCGAFLRPGLLSPSDEAQAGHELLSGEQRALPDEQRAGYELRLLGAPRRSAF
jgi:hypothetical protein